MKPSQRLTALALALALAFAAAAQPAKAQSSADCFDRTTDLAGMVACEQADGDARESPAISPWRAYELKEVHGRRVLLLDVRSRAEVALVGAPDFIDAVVPLAELALPYQADSERRDLRMVAEPNFVHVARAWISVLGGDEQTPLIVICRSGERSRTAARLLRAAGYADVSTVAGGFEGTLGRDGRRYGGWKDAGLPWVAQVDPALMFGEPD
jgi:rhodanese-related sulfurtransferase